MNYKIITDEVRLSQFVDWLPNLKLNETFYCCLFARNKYCTGISHVSSDKAQLKRFTATKRNLISKLKQLECPVGAYYTSKDHNIPQESLAVYISLNPRDMERATRASLIKLATLLGTTYNGYNPHQEVMSEIQKSVSRKIYTDLDFDNVSFESMQEEIINLINKEAITVLKTRGGFHLLIEHSKIQQPYAKTWYLNLTQLEGCDQNKDIMIPVVGCTQGGFTPHFLNF